MKVQWTGGGPEFRHESDFEDAILLYLQHALMDNIKITM